MSNFLTGIHYNHWENTSDEIEILCLSAFGNEAERSAVLE